MKHKKYTNRILSFLTVICCLAGSVLPAYSSRASDVSGGSVTPRVEFINKPKPAPDLYVTKQIENPEDFTEGPQQALERLQFTFTLKLNGKTETERREYKIIDASGNIKKDDKGNDYTFYAEKGKFRIGAGETAWFKDIDVGTEYEVSEDPEAAVMVQPDGKEIELQGGFRQILPEGGMPAAGIMTARGKNELFKNSYIPSGDGETTTLRIKKSVSFVEDYEAPEPQDEFNFIIRIKEKPYANQDFLIINADGESEGRGTTDSEGRFKLKGGCTAEFRDVDADVYYEVEETDIPDGWWAVGDTHKDGMTQASEMWLDFNNSNASFSVSKQMSDGSKPDTDFMFLLTKEDNTVWKDTKYYVYDIRTKEPVESGNPATTKEDGTFTLRAGQIAIFTGIQPGTKYSVKEVRNPQWEDSLTDYRQVTPANIEGYPNREVGNTAVLLPFENEAISTKNTLTVTKLVENVKNDAAEDANQTEFSFKLSKITEIKDSDGNITETKTEAVPNQDYELLEGGEEMTGSTDEDGVFTLKANAIARFTAILPGKYQVEELSDEAHKLAAGYTIKGEHVQSGELVRNESLSFAFTNQYLADRLDLNLIKTTRKTDGVYLKDAEFTLWKIKTRSESDSEGTGNKEETDEAESIGNTGNINDLTWSQIGDDQKIEVGTYTTDKDGRFQIIGLESGVYFLEETKTQDGYRLPKEPFKIVISRDPTDRSHLTVTVNGKTVTYETDNTKYTASIDDIANPENLVKMLELKQYEKARDEVDLEIINDVVYQLPESGGEGIYWYMIVGTALMLAAVSLYWKRYRMRSV